MKIRYKKITISTNVDPCTFSNNIINELVKSGYIITNQTQNYLEFKYNIWKFGSRNEAFSKMDGGAFNFNAKRKTIVFSFYLNPLFEIVAAAIFTFLGITQDNYLFLFIVFILIMLMIRIQTLKGTANKLIGNINTN